MAAVRALQHRPRWPAQRGPCAAVATLRDHFLDEFKAAFPNEDWYRSSLPIGAELPATASELLAKLDVLAVSTDVAAIGVSKAERTLRSIEGVYWHGVNTYGSGSAPSLCSREPWSDQGPDPSEPSLRS